MKKENNKNTVKWIYGKIKKYIPLIALITLIYALSAVSFVVLALLTKNVIDIATGKMSGSFLIYSLSLAAVVIFQVVLNAAGSFLTSYTNGRLTVALREDMFKTLCGRRYSDISGYHSGDLLNRFTSDADVIVTSSVSIIPSAVSIVTKIIAGIGAMLFMNPIIAAAVLILGISVPALGRMINKKYKYMHKECQKTEGKSRSFMQECFENMVVIKTFSSENPFVKRLNGFMQENFRLKMKRTGISILASLSLYSFFTIGYYGVLIWGAGRIAAGAITYGTLTAFLQLVSQLRAPLQNVSGIMPQYYSALASAERLMEIENIPSDKAAECKTDGVEFNSLEIKNVCFSYGADHILKDCSFTAEKGKITAITGESGSGKSTLFKLILGLYTPQSGSIKINGEITAGAETRRFFSYVPQGNMVLSGSIRDNITLCDPDVSGEKLATAAKVAEIYDYISSLPDGFDTVLAERGAGLSEGQIQRISIARALLADAPVLLLDEATSALDEATEMRLLQNIKNMTGKTVLFITHRNTSLKICDRIIHVENKEFRTLV